MDDNKDLPRKAGIAISAVLLGGTLVAGSLVGQATNARSLTPPATAALAQAGVSGVDLTMKGREAYLTTSTGTQADLDKAKQAVEAVHGVRWARVSGGTTPTPPPAPTTTTTSAAPPSTTTMAPTTTTTAAPPPTTTAPTTSVAPPTTSTQAPVPVDAAVKVVSDANGVTLNGTVATQAEADALNAAVGKAFGTPVINKLTVDPNCTSPAWLPALATALGQAPAISQGSLDVTRQGISLTGTVASAADATALQQVLGTVPLTLDSKIAVQAPTTPGTQALTPDEVAQVNGTVVNYNSGVYTLDATAKSKLDAIVPLLAKSNAHVTIKGYMSGTPAPTDAANSTRRAQAVADYLVAHGIDATRLTVTGMGTADPVADNGTPAGQHANQRATLTIEGN